MDEHNGLDYILSLHGTRVNREDGYCGKSRLDGDPNGLYPSRHPLQFDLA